MGMFDTIRNAWKLPDLKKKLSFLIFAIIAFRFGYSIYVPYVETGLLAQQFAQNSGNLLGYFNILSGGGLSSASIFALSVYPYINSSIIIQLLQVAIPALERLAKEGGEEGKKKLNAYTRYLAVVLSAILGYSYFVLLNSYNGVLNRNDFWAGFVIVITFMAGSTFIMWLGEQMTEKGIGNGISMILFIGILSRGPAAISTIYTGLRNGTMKWWSLIIILAIALGIIAFIVFITKAERRIPIQYAKRVVGRKMFGGQSTNLPMKVNMSGVMPVIFSSTIVTVPATIAQFFTPTEGTFWYKFVQAFSTGKPLYIIIYIGLIFAFAYFYSAIQFNPIEVANNLKKNGGFIPGFRPGKPTSDFIAKVVNKITMMGAIFLAIVAGLPLVVSNVPGLGGLAIGGTSVIIAVSVALETVSAIEQQMLMRHYKGFLE